jgi:hypothetical protein
MLKLGKGIFTQERKGKGKGKGKGEAKMASNKS